MQATGTTERHQHETARIENDARTQAPPLVMAGGSAGLAKVEKAVEQIVKRLSALRPETASGNADRCFRVDVDDGRLNLRCNARKAT